MQWRRILDFSAHSIWKLDISEAHFNETYLIRIYQYQYFPPIFIEAGNQRSETEKAGEGDKDKAAAAAAPEAAAPAPEEKQVVETAKEKDKKGRLPDNTFNVLTNYHDINPVRLFGRTELQVTKATNLTLWVPITCIHVFQSFTLAQLRVDMFESKSV